MPIPTLLHDLLSATGPSGHEGSPARVWRQAVEGFAAELRRDTMGSTMALVRGAGEGPTVALVGHVDEIGLHITHITEDGFLRCDRIGGWDPAQLIGQRVRILIRGGGGGGGGGERVGVIGRTPTHLLTAEDKSKGIELTDLRIDIGARNRDDARALVQIGDVAVVDVAPVEFPNGRVVSRAIDNRSGAFVVAEAARLISEAGGAPGDVWAIASAQEEIGLNGARTSVFGLAPDLVIVVDTTPATDQPGVKLGDMTEHELGAGPVIARGVTLHPHLSDLLIQTAEELGIDVVIESLGALTGSDADAAHLSRAGIPTALVSITIRYMHSPVEMADLADIDAAARLIAAAVGRLDQSVDLLR